MNFNNGGANVMYDWHYCACAAIEVEEVAEIQKKKASRHASKRKRRS